MFDPEANLDLDQLRAWLAKMTDVELRSFGKSAAYYVLTGGQPGH